MLGEAACYQAIRQPLEGILSAWSLGATCRASMDGDFVTVDVWRLNPVYGSGIDRASA